MLVTEIDPDLADTAALNEAYGLDPHASANCVLVVGRRGGDERVAACVVRATTRADVNTLVRRLLDVRKATFLPTDRAVADVGHGVRRHHADRPARSDGACWCDADVLADDASRWSSAAGVRRLEDPAAGPGPARRFGVEAVDGLGRRPSA